MPALYIVILSVAVCNAQFPKKCVNRDSLVEKVCCPIGNDTSPCNSKSLKGFCVTHTQFQYYHPGNEGKFSREAELDDKAHWPSRFFDKICMCQGHFFGPDCGQCDYGYEGENCNILKTPKKRKNALNLTKEEKDLLVDTLDQAKTDIDPDYVIVTSSAEVIQRDLNKINREDKVRINELLNKSFKSLSYWDVITWLHYFTATPPIDPAHGGAAFLPWHRYFLLLVEERLQKVANNDNLTIPYWDWTTDYGNNCSVCRNDLVGAMDEAKDGRLSKNSPFRKWKVVCTDTSTMCDGTTGSDYLERHIRDWAPLPNARQIKELLDIIDYDRIEKNSGFGFERFQSFSGKTSDSFRSSLEYDYHNMVHVWVGGAMSSTRTASNDPLFFLHHCNVDRIFETWLQKHADTAQYGCIRFGVKDDSNEPEGCPIGHDIREFMAPFFPLKTPYHAFRPSKQFGYQYDQLAGGR